MKQLLLLLAIVALLASCSKSDDKLQYMPFQEEKDGKWGMMGTDGKVLFSDEFKEMPTVVMNGVFFAKNGNDKWELYSAEEKPQQIGKEEYEQAGAFIEDVAPVVAKGKHIQFIDKSGQVKFELDKAGGKSIEECTNFSDGVAVFKAGEFYGCINTSGKVIVEPEYLAIMPANDGKMLAINKKYKDKDQKDMKITVLSTAGQEISEISMKKYSDIGSRFVEGALAVEEKSSDGETKAGLIDEKGEEILKPSSKIHRISDIHDGKIIFYDGDGYGLMDMKGEIILRAKYDALAFSGKDGILIVKKDKNKSDVTLINEKGDEVSKDTYENIYGFHGDLAVAKDGDNSYIFINDKGEDQKLKTDIYYITEVSYGDNTFQSQYFDVKDFINSLSVKNDGIMGLTLSMNAQNIVKAMNSISGVSVSSDPESYTYSSDISGGTTINKVDVTVAAAFTDNVGRAITTTKTDEWGFTYEYTTGYEFNNLTPKNIEITINNGFLIKGHMNEVTNQLITLVKSFGNTVKSNKNAALVKVGQQYYFVAFTGKSIFVIYGAIDPEAIDFSQYADVTEDSDAGSPSINSYEDQDSAVVDSSADVEDYY